MRIPVTTILILAWRNLWRNYRRTLIMLAAISVGVWAMIFMSSLNRGMVDEMVKSGIQNLPGHVQIHHPDYRDDPSVVNSISGPNGKLLDVLQTEKTLKWTSRIRVPAVVSSERDSRGVVLLGIDPLAERSMTKLESEITDGRYLKDSKDKGLIIGMKLAQRLDTRLGKRVVVMSQDPDNNIADRGFRVVGLYQSELDILEETFIYAARDTVQTLLNMDKQVSQIAIMGDDYRNVELLYREIKASAPENVEVLPWQQLDSYLGTMLNVMDGFVLVWVIVVFLALSFGLANTLIMAVFERVREIGLMQALGMRPALIMYQVLLESFLLLGLGLTIGNLAAVASIKSLEDGIDLSFVGQGMEMMGAGSMLYPALYVDDMVLASSVVIILGLLTSILPAWHAARYDPIVALSKT